MMGHIISSWQGDSGVCSKQSVAEWDTAMNKEYLVQWELPQTVVYLARNGLLNGTQL